MKTPALLAVARIGLITLGALSSGCSLLGLAVDASRQPDTLAVNPGEKTLEGKNVLVTMRDGYSFAGECRRVANLPGKLYRSRYARWQSTEGRDAFPLSPDDTLHIAWDHGQIALGSLEGFTQTSIVVIAIPPGPALFRPRQQVLSIPLEKIDSLRTRNGTVLDRRMLGAWLGERRVPTTGAMLVQRAESSVWVPMDEIVRICEIRYSYQWFNTGAIVDVAGLVTVAVLFAVRSN